MQEIPESVWARVNSIPPKSEVDEGKRRRASKGRMREFDASEEKVKSGLVGMTTTTATEPMVASRPKAPGMLPEGRAWKLREKCERVREGHGQMIEIIWWT